MGNSFTAIEKSIEVLKRLGNSPYEMTAIELGQELSLNRSTVHRILNAYMSQMFVLQNPITKKYSLGPAAYHMGCAYLITLGGLDQIRHIVNEIAKETEQSIGYSILSGEKILNIFEVESFQQIKIGYRPGDFYPINCGAYGKCIMAFCQPEKRLREIVYANPLVEKTPYSITDPEKLLEEYRKIRQQGYAISDEEGMLATLGIAAPVRNSEGKVIACVGAAVVKGTISSEQFEFLKQKVIEGANKISRLMP